MSRRVVAALVSCLFRTSTTQPPPACPIAKTEIDCLEKRHCKWFSYNATGGCKLCAASFGDQAGVVGCHSWDTARYCRRAFSTLRRKYGGHPADRTFREAVGRYSVTGGGGGRAATVCDVRCDYNPLKECLVKPKRLATIDCFAGTLHECMAKPGCRWFSYEAAGDGGADASNRIGAALSRDWFGTQANVTGCHDWDPADYCDGKILAAARDQHRESLGKPGFREALQRYRITEGPAGAGQGAERRHRMMVCDLSCSGKDPRRCAGRPEEPSIASECSVGAPWGPLTISSSVANRSHMHQIDFDDHLRVASHGTDFKDELEKVAPDIIVLCLGVTLLLLSIVAIYRGSRGQPESLDTVFGAAWGGQEHPGARQPGLGSDHAPLEIHARTMNTGCNLGTAFSIALVVAASPLVILMIRPVGNAEVAGREGSSTSTAPSAVGTPKANGEAASPASAIKAAIADARRRPGSVRMSGVTGGPCARNLASPGEATDSAWIRHLQYREWVQEEARLEPSQLLIVMDSRAVSFGGCDANGLLAQYNTLVRASEGPTVVALADNCNWPLRVRSLKMYDPFVHRSLKVLDAQGVGKPYAQWPRGGRRCSGRHFYAIPGFLMGPASELLQVLRCISRLGWADKGFDTRRFDEQVGLIECMYQQPDLVALDYGGNLVMDLHGFDHGVLARRGATILNRASRQVQCFIHSRDLCPEGDLDDTSIGTDHLRCNQPHLAVSNKSRSQPKVGDSFLNS